MRRTVTSDEAVLSVAHFLRTGKTSAVDYQRWSVPSQAWTLSAVTNRLGGWTSAVTLARRLDSPGPLPALPHPPARAAAAKTVRRTASPSPAPRKKPPKGSRPAAGSAAPVTLDATQRAARLERMRALRSAGRSLDEIGAEVGLTRERVRQLLGPTGSVLGQRAQARDQRLRGAAAAVLAGPGEWTVEEFAAATGAMPDQVRSRGLLPAERTRVKHRAPRGPQYSDEDLIAAVRRAAGEGPPADVLTRRRYGTIRAADPTLPHSAVILSRTGLTWAEVLTAAGLPTGTQPAAPPGTPRIWTKQACLLVIACWLVEREDPGKHPTRAEMKTWLDARDDMPSMATITARTGRWPPALAAAEDLSAPQRRLRELLARPPRQHGAVTAGEVGRAVLAVRHLHSSGRVSQRNYRTVAGAPTLSRILTAVTWEELLDRAGIPKTQRRKPVNRDTDKLNAVRTWLATVGDAQRTTSAAYDAWATTVGWAPSSSAIRRAHGSWPAALAAGRGPVPATQ